MTETEAVLRLRLQYPFLRRTRSVAIERSGQCQTVYGCLCGARHTACSDYRQARHVKEFMAKHSGCAEAILSGQIPFAYGRTR